MADIARNKAMLEKSSKLSENDLNSEKLMKKEDQNSSPSSSITDNTTQSNRNDDCESPNTPVSRTLRNASIRKQQRRASEDRVGNKEEDKESSKHLFKKKSEPLRSIKEDFKSFKEDVSDFFSDDEEDDSDDSLSDSESYTSESDERSEHMIKNRRRRSALKMFRKPALGAPQRSLQTAHNMEVIRQQLGDTYRMEDDNNSILLHGYLHIKIIGAKHLRYFKWNCRRGALCRFSSHDISPYVTVHAGRKNRLLKTPTISHDASPQWNLDFFVPVCQAMKHLEFRVKERLTSDLIGRTFLPVRELIRFAEGVNDDCDNIDYAGINSNATKSGSSATKKLSGSQHAVSKEMNNGDMPESTTKSKAEKETHKKKPKLVRAGVHRTVHLDNKPHHGAFEYSVQFIPKGLLHDPPMTTLQRHNRDDNASSLNFTSSSRTVSNNDERPSPVISNMVVPGVYFPLRQGNRMRYYINANDKGDTPKVHYGTHMGIAHKKKVWKPHRYFRDVYDSMCHAEHMIYVVGWSVDHTVSLLRGEEAKTGLNERKDGSNYSPILGELLNQKAKEGVTVNLLVWDDRTSTVVVGNRGVIGTRDEELRGYFANSKVNLLLVPMSAVKTSLFKQFRMSVFYTHHQKCVITDTPNNELEAYVGGIDLTFGRYDDGNYPLFRTLKTEHKDDFHNWCTNVSQSSGPREPWHDIHSRVQGPGAMDLVQNFEERWVGQGGAKDDLVNLEDEGIRASAVDDNDDAWSTQLYRSISDRVASLQSPEIETSASNNTDGVKFEQSNRQKVSKKDKFIERFLKVGEESEQYFVGSSTGDGKNITVSRPLSFKRHEKVDSSIHRGLVHHIRNAQHSIYMESQYFLSSSFLWDGNKTSKCCNLIAAEIATKICEKIELGKRFTTYIVIPMWPEGLPGSAAGQEILCYQALTMRSMYKRVQQSIDRRRKELEAEGEEQAKAFADVTPTDYLSFYCLANRETSEGGQDIGGGGLLNRTRRHLIYCHSKLAIIDDAVILLGSANINQRSLDGSRDSELMLGAWQPNHLPTVDSVPNGDVHGFRLQCFAHVTRTMVDAFRDPSSLECIRQVNDIAKENWKRYTADEVCELKSYLVPYPVKVKANGDLAPLTTDGKFPDTSADILGSLSNLPKYLTT